MANINTVCSREHMPLTEIGKKVATRLYHTMSHRFGTIVPWHWLAQLRTASGYTDEIAAIILGDIVAWWTPYPVSEAGSSIKLRKKFKYDLPQISYSNYQSKAGWTREQVRRAFCRLEQAGFITRIFRNVRARSPYYGDREITLQSRMFVELHVEVLFDKLGAPEVVVEEEDSSADEFEILLDPIAAEPDHGDCDEDIPPKEPELIEDCCQTCADEQPVQEPIAIAPVKPKPSQQDLMIKSGQGSFVTFADPELQAIHKSVSKKRLPEWRDQHFASYEQYLSYINWLIKSTEGWSEPCRNPEAYARKAIIDIWSGKGHPTWARFVDGESPIEDGLGANDAAFDAFLSAKPLTNEELLIEGGFGDIFR